LSARNLRLLIAYDGSGFAGWQIQPSAPTVQGAIETALQQITQRPCRLRAAGRTDAGVHALGQVANTYTESPIGCDKLRGGLNALLREAITIREIDEVNAAFDARRDARGKHYRYAIHNARTIPPLLRRSVHHVHRPLQLQAMADAAARLVGQHDFAAFRAASCERETTVRTLYRCTVAAHGPAVHIDVEGTAFLKNMVRIIAGTLIEVGLGRRAPASIDALLAAGDRTQAGVTAPPQGLCLVEVFYAPKVTDPL
jgi:tRNA pseudouridine38-40 synthase